MSIRLDYIPRKDSELVPWSANFTAGIAANSGSWGIPTNEVIVLQTSNTTFATLHAQADSPARTAILVAEK
ncbi:MAG: hypothetical protein LBD27_01020, partial [Tannerella sp.]|nr:hypothetical protein [Tannerella sp.]